MSRKDDIRHIWTECFDDTEQWVAWWFDRVYDDSQAMTVEVDGKTLSSLLLQQYRFAFHGTDVSAGYISGAATRRSARGRGHMSALMVRALMASRERGDMLCALIPAQDYLYFFYDRFGFSTVFYVDKQRFTSRHLFAGRGDYREVTDCFAPEVWEAMERMERMRGDGVIHSRRDFLNIIDDLRHDPQGRFTAMADDNGMICSMAWAVRYSDMVEVKELLAVDESAAQAALRSLRKSFPNEPFRLLAPAQGQHRRLYSRGMGRIVNVELCLQAVAAADSDWRAVMRVTDRLLPENSHTYRCGGGRVTVDDSYSGHLDFDIPVEVLNCLVFSDAAVGDITGFPSRRAHMALMID